MKQEPDIVIPLTSRPWGNYTTKRAAHLRKKREWVWGLKKQGPHPRKHSRGLLVGWSTWPKGLCSVRRMKRGAKRVSLDLGKRETGLTDQGGIISRPGRNFQTSAQNVRGLRPAFNTIPLSATRCTAL